MAAVPGRPKKGRRFGGDAAHQKAMMGNLVASLIAAEWSRGVDEARDRGTAILIGHVQNRAVVDILKAGERELPGRQVRLSRLVDVIARRERNPTE